jgi:hypothetical protein
VTFPFNTSAPFLSETITTRDAKGNVAHNTFYMDAAGGGTLDLAGADFATLVTAFLALSNAALQRAHGVEERYGTVQYGAHTSGGAYESVIDKAVMVFQDTSGGLHRYEIPAPKIAIFKNDKITVDPANSTIVTFVGLMTTAFGDGNFVCVRNGLQLVNYMGGFYKARKLRRRLNVLILQPDLTAALPAE